MIDEDEIVTIKGDWKYRMSEFWHRIWGFFDDFPGKWWLFHRFHPRHRYNIVHTGLEPGYYDPDTRISCAIANEFCRFVDAKEKELSDAEDLEDFVTSALGKKFDRMKAIRDWIKSHDIDPPKMRSSDGCHDPKKIRDEYDEITKILCEIIEMRKILWY